MEPSALRAGFRCLRVVHGNEPMSTHRLDRITLDGGGSQLILFAVVRERSGPDARRQVAFRDAAVCSDFLGSLSHARGNPRCVRHDVIADWRWTPRRRFGSDRGEDCGGGDVDRVGVGA